MSLLSAHKTVLLHWIREEIDKLFVKMQKYVITNFCIYTNLMYVEKVLSMNISSTNVHTRNEPSKH